MEQAKKQKMIIAPLDQQTNQKEICLASTTWPHADSPGIFAVLCFDQDPPGLATVQAPEPWR